MYSNECVLVRKIMKTIRWKETNKLMEAEMKNDKMETIMII